MNSQLNSLIIIVEKTFLHPKYNTEFSVQNEHYSFVRKVTQDKTRVSHIVFTNRVLIDIIVIIVEYEIHLYMRFVIIIKKISMFRLKLRHISICIIPMATFHVISCIITVFFIFSIYVLE